MSDIQKRDLLGSSILQFNNCITRKKIGVNKLREISNSPKCPFVIYIGRKRLIRRKEFEKYIGNQIEI